jgi:hypothetical protein
MVDAKAHWVRVFEVCVYWLLTDATDAIVTPVESALKGWLFSFVDILAISFHLALRSHPVATVSSAIGLLTSASCKLG